MDAAPAPPPVVDAAPATAARLRHPRQPGSGVVGWIRRAVDALGDVAGVAWDILFSFGVSLLAAVAIYVPDQCIEALRVVAEDARFVPLAALFASAFILSLMAWHAGRTMLYLTDPHAIEAKGAHGWAARNLPRISGVLPLAALGLAFLKAADPEFSGETAVRTQLLVLGVTFLASAALLWYGLLVRRRALRKRETAPRLHTLHGATLPRSTWMVLAGSTALSVAVFVAVWATAGQVAVPLGAVTVLLLGVAGWIPIGSVVSYVGWRERVPLVAVLVGLAVLFSAFNLNDNHPIRSTRAAGAPPPTPAGEAFRDWLLARADRDGYGAKPYPVILVTAEGGGLRAAYQTAMVLSALQDRCPGFAQHVFAVSGVSGGSVGGAVFGAIAADSARNGPFQGCREGDVPDGRLQALADTVLARDFLSPVVAMALYPDLLQRFLPFAVSSFDRTRGLERGFERSWRGNAGSDRMAEPYPALRGGAADGATPAMLFNATQVETGRRLVFSDLSMWDTAFAGLRSLADADPRVTVPLSAAAVTSARFTYVTPAGYLMLPSGDGPARERFVDGGYFENSGTATALDVLRSMRDVADENLCVSRRAPSPTAPGPAAAAAADRPVCFMPVVIRIGFVARTEAAKERAGYRDQGLAEALSPVRALLNARDARGVSSSAELDAELRETRRVAPGAGVVDFTMHEDRVPLILGWLLSRNARLAMTSEAGPSSCSGGRPCAYRQVFTVLRGGPAPVPASPEAKIQSAAPPSPTAGRAGS